MQGPTDSRPQHFRGVWKSSQVEGRGCVMGWDCLTTSHGGRGCAAQRILSVKEPLDFPFITVKYQCSSQLCMESVCSGFISRQRIH